MSRIWFVTGCSTGFGRELVQFVVDAGERVVATARNPSSLAGFRNASASNFLPLKLDVTSQAEINDAFDIALRTFGRIDVVVNNAGFVTAGPMETISDAQLRYSFDVNVFGLIAITRRAIRTMREQSPPGGMIQQISSLAGQFASPLMSIYASAKWAVEGFTESLVREMKPEWHINFQIVEPGMFRTDGAGRSVIFGEDAQYASAYDHISAEKFLHRVDGKQRGDVVKGSKALYKLATMANPPLRCVLGAEGPSVMQNKLRTYQDVYFRSDVLEIVTDTDFDEYSADSAA